MAALVIVIDISLSSLSVLKVVTVLVPQAETWAMPVSSPLCRLILINYPESQNILWSSNILHLAIYLSMKYFRLDKNLGAQDFKTVEKSPAQLPSLTGVQLSAAGLVMPAQCTLGNFWNPNRHFKVRLLENMRVMYAWVSIVQCVSPGGGGWEGR